MMKRMCLIGGNSPAAIGCLSSSGTYGQLARTCFVYALSSSALGGSMNETLPTRTEASGSYEIPGAMWRTLSVLPGELAREAMPLELATNNVFPLDTTDDGY